MEPWDHEAEGSHTGAGVAVQRGTFESSAERSHDSSATWQKTNNRLACLSQIMSFKGAGYRRPDLHLLHAQVMSRNNESLPSQSLGAEPRYSTQPGRQKKEKKKRTNGEKLRISIFMTGFGAQTSFSYNSVWKTRGDGSGVGLHLSLRDAVKTHRPGEGNYFAWRATLGFRARWTGRPGGKLTPQVRIGASLKIMLDELLTEKTLWRA